MVLGASSRPEDHACPLEKGRQPEDPKKPNVTSSQNALEQLISQFAQPLAFLRELIQNSLDASTTIIEVEVGFDKESDGCFVRVADNGHGMDRDIIDQKLTKLFASTKEDDLTKIGKFGIGFVSIFAIKPDLVVLETGQHGESWRLLFLPDRSFERRELNYPVEGTTVTVFLPRPREELKALIQDCHETVSFWCKHSDIEILFNGEAINQKFDLPDLPYQYHYKVEGTELVVAPSSHPEAFHGYYNRGLTLLEGLGSPLPHLHFKLRSHYLEHTLSRDSVRQDDNYYKALKIVEKAAYEGMPCDLFSKLQESDDAFLWEAAYRIVQLDDAIRKRVRKYKVFPSREGRLSLAEFSKRVYYASEFDELWMEVEQSGETIIQSSHPHQDPRLRILEHLGYELQPLTEAFFRYRKVAAPEKSETALLSMLRKTTRQLLAPPFLVESLNLPSRWQDRFCAYLHPKKTLDAEPEEEKKWREAIGIRRDHPYWKRILQLYDLQPELAISMLVRMINLELKRNLKHEGRLFQTLAESVRKKAAL